jgi:aryl-alcohol dehydrogenase-like predicted oxidoreductase
MKTTVLGRRTLGRTGLQATIVGLGSGGFSRLGAGQNKGDDNAVRVVRAALDAGINLIDTAEAYGTEEVIGSVLQEVGRQRDGLILSTKVSYKTQKRLKTAAEIEAALDASLKRLHTDCVDIYHVHGITIDDYAAVVESTLPVLLRMREKGKLRFIGITEYFGGDTRHAALVRAVEDDYWDVMMVGFNLLNTTAREMLFKTTQAKGIGVLCMFAVRQALISLERLGTYLNLHVRDKGLDARVLQALPLVRHLLESGQCASLTEAAYRYCRYEPGIDCVLAGTGSEEHLRQNIADIQKPLLPADFIAQIEPLFAGLAELSGQ